MPERDVCLVVPASYWFEMQGQRPDPELGQVEYKLRCRLLLKVLWSCLRRFANWLTHQVGFVKSSPCE